MFCSVNLTNDNLFDIITQKEVTKMFIGELHDIVEKIKNFDASPELCQYLGCMYSQFWTRVDKKDESCLNEIQAIVRVLHKVSRSLSGSKAYNCGYYAAKMEALIEKFNERKIDEIRYNLLTEDLAMKIFKYLYKNGCRNVKTIEYDLDEDLTCDEISDMLDRLIMADLVSSMSTTTTVFYELTAAGYVYYYTKFERWGK